MPKNSVDQLADHSRRIKMLEDIFMPMAKAAMEILMGKPGEPGMGENVRRLTGKVDNILQAQTEEREEARVARGKIDGRLKHLEDRQDEYDKQAQQKHETRLLGMKVGSDARIAIVTGVFTIIGIVISKFI
jgi:hypothetical protein